MMYKFIRDNDGHWYLIQVKYQDMFRKWVRAMETGETYLADFSDDQIESDPSDYVMTNKPEVDEGI